MLKNVPGASLPSGPDSARAWAQAWVDAWNARDLDAVLARFAAGARFSSPKAAAITGQPQVIGHDALRAYWTQALATIGSLRFTLSAAYWDPSARTLVIRYVAELGGQRVEAAEVLELDEQGQARQGTALYGAAAA